MCSIIVIANEKLLLNGIIKELYFLKYHRYCNSKYGTIYFLLN